MRTRVLYAHEAFTGNVGAFFWYQHGRTLAQLSRFLLARPLSDVSGTRYL